MRYYRGIQGINSWHTRKHNFQNNYETRDTRETAQIHNMFSFIYNFRIWKTYYIHKEQVSCCLAVGQRVREGQEENTAKGREDIGGLMALFIISRVRISQGYTDSKSCQIHFKYVQFIVSPLYSTSLEL